MAKPLDVGPPVIVANPPASGRTWCVHSWACPLTFIVRKLRIYAGLGVGLHCHLGSSTMANGAAHPSR